MYRKIKKSKKYQVLYVTYTQGEAKDTPFNECVAYRPNDEPKTICMFHKAPSTSSNDKKNIMKKLWGEKEWKRKVKKFAPQQHFVCGLCFQVWKTLEAPSAIRHSTIGCSNTKTSEITREALLSL